MSSFMAGFLIGSIIFGRRSNNKSIKESMNKLDKTNDDVKRSINEIEEFNRKFDESMRELYDKYPELKYSKKHSGVFKSSGDFILPSTFIKCFQYKVYESNPALDRYGMIYSELIRQKLLVFPNRHEMIPEIIRGVKKERLENLDDMEKIRELCELELTSIMIRAFKECVN